MPAPRDDTRTLGLFAKAPGRARSSPAWPPKRTPQWAARVAEAFLHHTVKRLVGVAARRVLAFASAEFEAVNCGRFLLVPQADGDLGGRMAAFVAPRRSSDRPWT